MNRWITLYFVAAILAGCSRPQINNTRLTAEDLQAMTDRMAESLASSPALAGRGADSRRWVIVMDRPANMTNDILPVRQRWAFVARLRALLNQTELMRQRNVVFVLSAEAAAALNRRQADAAGHRAAPTHVLAATFHALTQAGPAGRSDTYLCSFRLTELQHATLIWEDAWELKRSVVRNKLD